MGFTYIYLSKKDDKENLKPFSNAYSYFIKTKVGEFISIDISNKKSVEDIAVSIAQYVETYKDAVILIDLSLQIDDKGKYTDFSGVKLLEYLRIKHKLLNSIFVLGIEEIQDILNSKPEHYILLAPGNKYIQIPIEIQKLQDIICNSIYLKNEDELIQQYKTYVKTNFNIQEFGHSLANSFGLHILQKAQAELDENFVFEEEQIPLAFDKAELLYAYKKNLDQKDIAGKKMEGLRNFLRVNNRKILCIDDQGDEGWFRFYHSLCFKSNNINFKSYIPNEKDYVNEALKKITNEKPDILLLDLRLLGEKDEHIALEEISGYKVLKAVHEKFPSLPIIISSATNKSDNLTRLLNKGAFALWTKPRIEQGNIDVYEKHTELTTLIYEALTLYEYEIDKWKLNVEFKIQFLLEHQNLLMKFIDEIFDEIPSKKNLTKDEKIIKSLIYARKIILDTNFFKRKERNFFENFFVTYFLLYFLSERKKKNVVIIDEVLQEIQLTAFKKINPQSAENLNQLSEWISFKKSCEFSLFLFEKLNILFPKVYLNEHEMVSGFHKEVNIVKGRKKLENNNIEVLKKQERIIDIILEEDFQPYRAKIIQEIKEKKWLHADEVIKMLVVNYFSDCQNNLNILVINNDKGCKQSICNILEYLYDFNIEKFKKDENNLIISGFSQKKLESGISLNCGFQSNHDVVNAIINCIYEPFLDKLNK